MKKTLTLILALTVCLCLLCACGDVEIGGPAPEPAQSAPAKSGGTVNISFSGSSAKADGNGVAIHEGYVLITSPGEYSLSGSYEGQLRVDTGEANGDVYLVLNGVELFCANDCAINATQSKNLRIVAADGTENTVISGTEADMAMVNDASSGAAIFSEDDIHISGGGALKVCGYINNGIGGKDDISIESAALSVIAANNGIRGSESVTVNSGSIAVTAGNDGIKTTSAIKDGKGFVEINGGTVAVSSVGDGISAESDLRVNGGTVTVATTGDSTVLSCKAMKAKGSLSIGGGAVSLSSSDHCIHSTLDVNISGGELTLSSSVSKCVSAHGALNISDGVITADAGDDCLESKLAVNISGGEINITAANDGIKAGEKGNGFTAPVGEAHITGGSVIISAKADPVDAKAAFIVDGGTVFGVGSANNVKGFTGGTQKGIACSFSGTAGSTLSVGKLASMEPAFGFNCVIFSSADIASGSGYEVTQGSNSVTAQA